MFASVTVEERGVQRNRVGIIANDGGSAFGRCRSKGADFSVP